MEWMHNSYYLEDDKQDAHKNTQDEVQESQDKLHGIGDARNDERQKTSTDQIHECKTTTAISIALPPTCITVDPFRPHTKLNIEERAVVRAKNITAALKAKQTWWMGQSEIM
jgi:hypothetical protein